MKIVMKLKEIYKCLLLIFLYCNDTQNPKLSNQKTSKFQKPQHRYRNYKSLDKLKCYCRQLSSVALCPKQETRPANHTESRQKLQGRKPKFKFSQQQQIQYSQSKAQMQHANDNETTTTRIKHLTAKKEQAATAEATTATLAANSSIDTDSDCDCGSNVDRQLSKAAAKRGESYPAIDIWLNI